MNRPLVITLLAKQLTNCLPRSMRNTSLRGVLATGKLCWSVTPLASFISPRGALAFGLLVGLLPACSGIGKSKDSDESPRVTVAAPINDTLSHKDTNRTIVTLPTRSGSAVSDKKTANSKSDADGKNGKRGASDSAAGWQDGRSNERTSGWVLSAIDDTKVAATEIESDDGEADDYIDDERALAVDDETRQKLDMAAEYYSMGLVANQQAKWDEAQFYLERSLRLLSSADLVGENDTLPSELRQYNNLLENVVAAYHVTLLSLGKLSPDASPSALVEKFVTSEKQLLPMPGDISPFDDGTVSYDMPIKFNSRVLASIKYFQTNARDAFIRYFSRSTKYLPMIKEIIRSYGLPEDLAYLPLVESGYNDHAYSWAKAMGLWQFIASTGKIYDLDRSWWLDERRDPIKATHAACRFFKDLYAKFGDWEVCLAAYNGGPGRLERALKREGADGFWELKRLRKETHNYVPLFMAATIICKNPRRYGFNPDDVQFEAPLSYDVVETTKPLSLSTVAGALGRPVEDISALNPELLRQQTPPEAAVYQLRIPTGTKSAFLAAYDNLVASSSTYATHKVRKGESLGAIARQYGVSTYAIREANSLRSNRISSGRTLTIPVGADESAPTSNAEKRATQEGRYRVRRGDNLHDISRSFGVAIQDLRNANKLGRKGLIYVGQRLVIPGRGDGGSDATMASRDNSVSSQVNANATLEDRSGESITHVVRRGENLTVISQRYKVTVGQLRDWNNLGRSQTVYPAQKLRVFAGDNSAASGVATYTVKRGDNLSTIARASGQSVRSLSYWNDLDDDAGLAVGMTLRLSPPSATPANGSNSRKTLWHVVRRGENLSDIAALYDISVDRIASINGINNTSRITAGARLKITKDN